MKLLDDYLSLQQEIYDYFGYEEQWRVLPLDDCREYYWRLDGEGPGVVTMSHTVKGLDAQEGDEEENDLYEYQIYTQRHLPKWIYRGKDYTLIVVDSRTDMNCFLSIYDNAKEVK